MGYPYPTKPILNVMKSNQLVIWPVSHRPHLVSAELLLAANWGQKFSLSVVLGLSKRSIYTHREMSSPSAATRTAGSLLKPYRVFFRTSQTPTSIQQARAVFDSLRQYGDLIEYKFMRVSIEQRSWSFFIIDSFVFIYLTFSVQRHSDTSTMALRYTRTQRTAWQWQVNSLFG